MTREHKLSLILGFAVVLVVGVLLSDHLSGARQAQLEQTDPASSLALQEPAPASNQPPSLVLVDPDGRPVHLAQQPEPAAPASIPTLTMGEPPAAQPSGPFADSTMFRPVDPAPQESTGVQWIKDQFAGAVQDLANGAAPAAAAAVDDTPTSKAPVSRTPPVGASQRTYTVQAGDTLWGIAEKTLGDGFRHKEIAELNRDRTGPGGELRVGASLRLPADARVADAATSRGKVSEPTSKPIAPGARPGTTYTVKAGDTLGEISQKLLGTSRRYREILAANRDQLDDADSLRSGMVLKIPSR